MKTNVQLLQEAMALIEQADAILKQLDARLDQPTNVIQFPTKEQFEYEIEFEIDPEFQDILDNSDFGQLAASRGEDGQFPIAWVHWCPVVDGYVPVPLDDTCHECGATEKDI